MDVHVWRRNYQETHPIPTLSSHQENAILQWNHKNKLEAWILPSSGQFISVTKHEQTSEPICEEGEGENQTGPIARIKRHYHNHSTQNDNHNHREYEDVWDQLRFIPGGEKRWSFLVLISKESFGENVLSWEGYISSCLCYLASYSFRNFPFGAMYTQNCQADTTLHKLTKQENLIC